MKYVYMFLTVWLLVPSLAMANGNSQQVYQQSMSLAAQGKLSESIVALQVAHALLPAGDIWRERMLAASTLLLMREKQAINLPVTDKNNYLTLADAYVQTHALAAKARTWPVAVLATIFPGSGHAWLGRWHDAAVAALFVLPLLILTLWAAKRRMGPVTVFFALLTMWLWSGTIFSAISLAERGNFETYILLWQQLWQASALPGRPW